MTDRSSTDSEHNALAQALYEVEIYGIGATSDTNQRVIVNAAKKLATQPTAQCSAGSEEPAAYLHTMHMELGQTQRRLMWTEPSPFGIPGKHYDATYTVSCAPLYLNAAQSEQEPRLAERLTDVVMMLDTPDAYNREYIAAVCRSILSSLSSPVRGDK